MQQGNYAAALPLARASRRSARAAPGRATRTRRTRTTTSAPRCSARPLRRGASRTSSAPSTWSRTEPRSQRAPQASCSTAETCRSARKGVTLRLPTRCASSSPARPGSSARTSSATGCERHPDDPSSPRPADLRGQPREPRGTSRTVIRSSRGTSPTSTSSSDAARARDRRRRQLRGRVAQQPRGRRPGPLLRARTSSARSCCSRRARRTGVERFHHVSTCEVYGDLPLDSDESFTRGVAVPRRARRTTRRRRRRPLRARVPRDVRAADRRSRTARTTTGRSSSRRR